MSTPQREEPKRKVLVAPSLHGSNTRSLVLAGIASIISVAAHAAIIFLILNLDLGSAKGQNDGDVTSAPIMDEETKKDDKKPDPKQDADRKREEEIDLSQTDIGKDSLNDTNYNVPTIGDISVPQINPMVDPTQTPGFDDPKITNTTPATIPPPPGAGNLGAGGGLTADPNGTAAMIPGLTGISGYSGSAALTNEFAGRGQGVTRQRMLDEGGGNKESEAMVAKGLQFLANHQALDGHWSLHEFDRHARKQTKNAKGETSYVYEPDKSDPKTKRHNDTAGTAFGLLPFLAAGYTQNPVTGAKFDYSKSVKSGLVFLMKKQDKDGYFGGDMYAHGLATIAMCEAYGLSSDNSLKLSAQRAIHYIENSQDPSGGGWRYGPRQPGDTSVTGWQLMALKSGQMSGLTVNAKTLKLVESYLDSCESANKGGYSYTPGAGETSAMTAVGLLCRQYLGVTPRNPGLLDGVKRLDKTRPAPNQNIYYMYYATQVMHHMGGDNWEKWNKGPNGDGKGGMRDSLIAAMDKGTTNPDTEGSWVLTGAEGRLMATSLALLTLEVYYRHLPLYRRDVGAVKGAK